MTADRRIARGIAYVEQLQRFNNGNPERTHPEIATYWRTLADDYSSALEILRAAQPLPDALERICTVARLQICGGSLERRYLWHKIAAAMGLHWPPPGRTKAAP